MNSDTSSNDTEYPQVKIKDGNTTDYHVVIRHGPHFFTPFKMREEDIDPLIDELRSLKSDIEQETVECPHCEATNDVGAVEHQGVCHNCREEIDHHDDRENEPLFNVESAEGEEGSAENIDKHLYGGR